MKNMQLATDLAESLPATIRFGAFSLDTRKHELSCEGERVPLERQVYQLLLLLVAHRERAVSKEEIIDRIWRGRVVSDSAVSSRVKSLRRALADDGNTQHTIRTVYGHGFRFVAEVLDDEPAAAPAITALPAMDDIATQAAAKPRGKPSIAILPLQLVGTPGEHVAIADAIPHDLISSVARLQWLRVIARGSSFRFRSGEHPTAEIASALDVHYCLSGVVEISGSYLAIVIELEDARDQRVVWSETFKGALDNVHGFRQEIVNSIVSNLELQISQNEASLARVTAPDRLDAWSLYHLGLQHLMRFNREDNLRAGEIFTRVREMAPEFARGHAAMSCAHFQNAFLRYTGDRDGEIQRATQLARVAVDLDPLDPFANFSLGRSRVLHRDLEGAKVLLDRAIELSPNYAQGIYSRAFTGVLACQPGDAIRFSDDAMNLSPLDPLLYAMRCTQAFAYMMQGDIESAVRWAEKGARSPGAHVIIYAAALLMNILHGDRKQVAYWDQLIRATGVQMNADFFLQALPFQDPAVRRIVISAFESHGY